MTDIGSTDDVTADAPRRARFRGGLNPEGTPHGYDDDVPAEQRLTALIAELGGEPRSGQVRMVNVFEKAIRENHPAAVQAPTGVGKSIGSLTPAICSGQKTVVVTSSKALQDQLRDKDLPFLEKHLPVPFTWAVLKGRNNFACLAKANEAFVEIRRRKADADQGALFDKADVKGSDAADVDDDFDDEELVEEVERLLDWSERTVSGDRSELSFEPSGKAWAKVAVGQGECPGASNCTYGDSCFAERAKHEAEHADVVVVNAHLYGAHLAVGAAGNGGILPPHSILLIDEAHEFEDALVGALSLELGGMRIRQLRRAVKRVVAGASSTVDDLRDAADQMDDALAVVYDRVNKETKSSRLRPGPLAFDPLAVALTKTAKVVDNAVVTIRTIAGKSMNPSFENRCERALRMAVMLLDDCKKAIAADEELNVCWIEQVYGRHALKVGTIRIGGLLKTAVWDEGILGLLCSATLPANVPGRLGLSNATYADVESPFDYKKNGLLYVPDNLPDARNPKWAAAAAAETVRLIEAAGGRTLALFTSNSMMNKTVEVVREKLPQFTILCQGDAPKPALVQQFKDNESSCLFATASFWTGIDVPGSTLSLVIVDKLPFPVPTEPVFEARCDIARGGRPKEDFQGNGPMDPSFNAVSVPAAGVRLAQGVGRLIRTSSDRGVVAVLDDRLATKSYRQAILAVLPPFQRVRRAETVYDFLRSINQSS